ncbi:MAG: hypothetical protein ABSB97_01380 [Thermoplasmata archaeon]
MVGIDWSSLLQAILFALFADLTAIVTAVTGPTYDNLLVPELSPGALYPSLVSAGAGPANYLVEATHFSTYVLANVVDPAATLLAVAVAIAYLSKALVARWAQSMDSLLPRLVIAVVGANFTVPIAGALLGLGGALYPVLAGWDGGSWQHWVHLAGWGQIAFSWDNGVLAFILSIVEFGLVLALVLAVGVRDALLAVLIVVLPLFTLFWPLRPVSELARRAWFLFAELVFLPCVLVVPLELAVGSPNPVLLVGYLGAALASPYLLSLAGTHLVAFGFPGAGGTVQGGVARGISAAPAAATAHAQPLASAIRTTGDSGRAVAGAVRVAGSAAAPAAAPLAAAELIGHGALRLLRHLPGTAGRSSGPHGWRPIRGGGSK